MKGSGTKRDVLKALTPHKSDSNLEQANNLETRTSPTLVKPRIIEELLEHVRACKGTVGLRLRSSRTRTNDVSRAIPEVSVAQPGCAKFCEKNVGLELSQSDTEIKMLGRAEPCDETKASGWTESNMAVTNSGCA